MPRSGRPLAHASETERPVRGARAAPALRAVGVGLLQQSTVPAVTARGPYAFHHSLGSRRVERHAARLSALSELRHEGRDAATARMGRTDARRGAIFRSRGWTSPCCCVGPKAARGDGQKTEQPSSCCRNSGALHAYARTREVGEMHAFCILGRVSRSANLLCQYKRRFSLASGRFERERWQRIDRRSQLEVRPGSQRARSSIAKPGHCNAGPAPVGDQSKATHLSPQDSASVRFSARVRPSPCGCQ